MSTIKDPFGYDWDYCKILSLESLFLTAITDAGFWMNIFCVCFSLLFFRVVPCVPDWSLLPLMLCDWSLSVGARTLIVPCVSCDRRRIVFIPGAVPAVGVKVLVGDDEKWVWQGLWNLSVSRTSPRPLRLVLLDIRNRGFRYYKRNLASGFTRDLANQFLRLTSINTCIIHISEIN